MEEAEFDRFADEYYAQLRSAVSCSGKEPEFFAEYKVADAAAAARRMHVDPRVIVDFGSGIGSSIPYFLSHFPDAELICADVSSRSLEVAAKRFPGAGRALKIEQQRIPLERDCADLVFTACVFHHIDPAERGHWLEELNRVARPGGLLMVFEHNPWNPLTARTVKACPFDEHASLLAANELRRLAVSAGWTDCRVAYRLFFPDVLDRLRPLERFLAHVPLGAQYYVAARKPAVAPVANQ